MSSDVREKKKNRKKEKRSDRGKKKEMKEKAVASKGPWKRNLSVRKKSGRTEWF